MDQETAVSIRIEAPAAKVYDLVSDLTRMGQWSPECKRVEWLDGASGVAVGARFKGHNQRGARRWSTTGKVVAAEPGEFAFDVTSVFGLPVARWRYRVTPEGDAACDLTESWEDRRGGFMKFLGTVASGVSNRKEHNTTGMEETLRRIKTTAESAS
jgi:uncharacterized protein YndB with AHSA1/START domain